MEIERTYFLRSVDELGRVVLPIEIRKKLEINEADKLKIYTEGGRVIIENKYII